MQEAKHESNQDIDIEVLGQNLMQQAGEKGSFAASKMHAKTENKTTMFDGQTVSAWLRNGPVKFWAGWNYPDGEDLVPWARWQVEEPEDLEQKSKIWDQVADAATKFNLAGIAVDWQAAFEDFNIPLRGDGILDVTRVPGSQEGADDDELQPADTDAPNEPGQDEMSAKPKRRKKALTHVDGQLYVDALADRALKQGSLVLSTDVRAIAKVVAASRTPEELKRKLRNAFSAANPDEFALLMRRSLMMAVLAGKVSAKR
jgi:uncharacterized protein DUF935